MIDIDIDITFKLLRGEVPSHWFIIFYLPNCTCLTVISVQKNEWALKDVLCLVKCLSYVLQLSIKQELKQSETAVQMKKDKKAVTDLMICPKKKKRKQRSPAKVPVYLISDIISRSASV